MSNSSSSWSYFVLGAYVEVGGLKFLYLALAAVTYAAIIAANTSVILVICRTRSLHEPMFWFLASLSVNELYGSAGLFPFLLVQILSDVHVVSAPLCFLQIFCLYSYVKTEFCSLAVMSYDRYLAICRPLRYRAAMSPCKVSVLVCVVWFFSFATFAVPFTLTVRLTLCGNVLDSLYCRSYLVARLACSDTTLNNIYGLFGTALSVLVPLLLILFSYMKILRVCSAASSQTRRKAASTCAPHLTCLLNFSLGCLFEVLQSRFGGSGAAGPFQLLMSLYFLMLQPLLNPLMFGLQMSKIRNACRRFFG